MTNDQIQMTKRQYRGSTCAGCMPYICAGCKVLWGMGLAVRWGRRCASFSLVTCHRSLASVSHGARGAPLLGKMRRLLAYICANRKCRRDSSLRCKQRGRCASCFGGVAHLGVGPACRTSQGAEGRGQRCSRSCVHPKAALPTYPIGVGVFGCQIARPGTARRVRNTAPPSIGGVRKNWQAGDEY